MSSRRLRPIADPFVVAAPRGARVRTRLPVAHADHAVLWAVGAHLGSLAGVDLAGRCRAGQGPKNLGRAERKRALTAGSSSRWAGAITRTTADQWERGWNNLLEERSGLRRAVKVIQARLAVPVASRLGRVTGYRDRDERWQKQRRLQHLQARLAEVEARITAGRVSVTRGGRDLARQRHNLKAAGVTEAQWRYRWTAKRLFFTADGEADKMWGNETIRVHPDQGWVEIKLPAQLDHLANRPQGRYRLSGVVGFNHRAGEWVAQAATGAVRYDVTFEPARGRWYLDASWSTPPVDPPALELLRRQPTLGVDLNDQHIDCWVIAADGNPTGPAHTIPLDLAGLPASTRDGRLREAVTTIVGIATANGCASVTIEDLNFSDARAVGRETMGRGPRGKRFRRTVAGIPTGKLRDRLAGMAHNRGIWIIAVDPAYTSQWAAQHWRGPLNGSHSKDSSDPVTGHQAAAVVIGRRGLGHRARRRGGDHARHRRMAGVKVPPRPGSNPEPTRNPATRKGTVQPDQRRKTRPPDRTVAGNQAPQDRSGAPTGHDSLLHCV